MSENQDGMKRAMRDAIARGSGSGTGPTRWAGDTDADLVARTGRALYGQEWQSPLARDLGVQLRTIQRIAAAALSGQDYPAAKALLGSLHNSVLQRALHLGELQGELQSRTSTPRQAPDFAAIGRMNPDAGPVVRKPPIDD